MLFVDGDPGPEIRRKLNEMVTTWEQALVEAVGPAGWSPVLAVVSDSARRVLQITDWTGGEGTKPATGGYIGATGIVATAALAIDIRGPIGATGPSNTLAIGTVTSAASPSATITGASPNQTLNLALPKGDKGDTGNTGPANTLTIGTVTTGTASATITGTAPTQVLNLTVPQGIQGIQGPQGLKGDKGDTGNTGPQGIQGVQGVKGDAGWSPIFATVADGARFVLQVTDWAGGAGTKPAVGKYVGATGFVDAIASGVNVRGPAGTGSVSPSGTVAANDLAAFVDSLGTSIKAVKPADLPVSTATQNALNAKAPLNGTGTSGTWPINVSGQSASLLSTDSRSVKPNAIGSGSARTFFASKTGMEGGAVVTDWVDLFAFNTYVDGTGGLTNALAFSKAGAGLWHYQGVFNSAAWNAPKQIAYTDSSITGNAATATKLATARTINGVSFDGSANISVSVDWSSVTGKPAVIAAGATMTEAKTAISLQNVDNTSDLDKPISTATQTALDGKVDKVVGKGLSTEDYTTAEKTKLAGIADGATANTGTVTSVALSAPTGLTVSGSPVTSSGTLSITFTAGYSIPTDASQTNWNTAFGWGNHASAGYLTTNPVLGTPVSGNLSNCTVDGTNEIGFKNIPQNSQSAAYTLVASDAGKHILHPAADTTARTYTIPSNASVPYPIGTAITFINQNGTGGIVTIAITTDTMRLAGAGTTGSRTLARNGVATALKITATEWIISGSGLT